MKVLPIKLPDDFYYTLKSVAIANDQSMADYIRDVLDKPLAAASKQKKVKEIKKKLEHKALRQQTYFEATQNAIFEGPLTDADKSIDELLYGDA